jgi:hypothetical protein
MSPVRPVMLMIVIAGLTFLAVSLLAALLSGG